MILGALLTSCGGAEDSKEEGTESDNHTEASHDNSGASTKGNWNADDVAKAEEAMAQIDEQLAAFGDKKDDFKDCYLEKVMNTYNSFAEADTDIDGCSKLAEACASEVMGM